LEVAQGLFGDASPIDHLDQLATLARFLRPQDRGGYGDLAEAMGEQSGGTAGVL